MADALPALPIVAAEYCFWTSDTKAGTAPIEYRRQLDKVFEAAIIEGYSHQFRHTFAVELLIGGTPLETVSKLSGHKSVAVTERHYAAGVPERPQSWRRLLRALGHKWTTQLDRNKKSTVFTAPWWLLVWPLTLVSNA